MGEMAEAPAPVDQSPPSEVSSGAGESQAAASDCYNARAMTGSEANETPQAESPTTSDTAERDDGQSDDSSGRSSEGREIGEDLGAETDQEKAGSKDQMEGRSSQPQEPGLEDSSAGDPSAADSGVEPTGVDAQGRESDPPETEQAPLPAMETPAQEAAQEAADGSQEEDPQAREDPNQAKQAGNNENNPKPHKLKYDKQKEKELARRQMMNPHYFLPTDFSKHFDIATGQGPKQSEESPMARANRRLDEMKAWRKKQDQQSPMVYNRKVGKPGT